MTLPRYMTQLDALRGIAVLVVMISHINGDVPSLHIGTLFHYGWAGVDLFFVLSGFLITGILLRTKDDSTYFINFYARRILRIWPLYFCLLAFGFLLVPMLQPGLKPTVTEQCHPWQAYLFFVQNLIVPKGGAFGPLEITWSLCVEEQFYLLWPIIVLLCSPKVITRIAAGAVLISLTLRFSAAHHWLHLDTYHNTLCRLDGLALGSIAAILLPRYPAKTIRRASLLLGTLAAVSITATVPFTLVMWAFPALISVLFVAGMCLSLSITFSPRIRFLSYAGRISYGLYLLHALAFDVLRDKHIRHFIAITHSAVFNDLLLFLCSMSLAFVLAQTSWKFLESPALSLKQYFEPNLQSTQSKSDCLPAIAASA
jgi:peptidoglycan/LPS O-acetylase OafA/YrhL